MPKPGLKAITVKDAVYEKLSALAADQGLSISRYLERQLAGQSLDHHQDSPDCSVYIKKRFSGSNLFDAKKEVWMRPPKGS